MASVVKNPMFSAASAVTALASLFSLFGLSSTDLALPTTSPYGGGRWSLLRPSIGISAMHMQVLRDGTVVIFDRTDFGPSNLSLPHGRCRHDPADVALKVDCTAHSLLYNVESNSVRPLNVQTDTWCSSGAVRPDGTLMQTGGYNDGERKVRTFAPCPRRRGNSCDWTELEENLVERRWYASNHILPDGRVIIVGGRNVFTYEFVPKTSAMEKSFYLKFLKETRDFREENNLYPFLHLLPDGNLFIFANKRSILLDYKKNWVIKEYRAIPGFDKRNYPSTGSSVLLPMRLGGGPEMPAAEVMICGGSPPGAFTKSDKRRVFVEASRSCGRLRVSDPDPEWTMEQMPMPRVMSDMLLLPNGHVLMINGATNGTAGWEDGRNAVHNPILYLPDVPGPARRFEVLTPARVPRMYHSAAVVVPDGRVLVGGSNPHSKYNFTAYPYPTDLSLEAFYPPYLNPQFTILRPSILSLEAVDQTVSYSQRFSVNFVVTMFRPRRGLSVALLAPPFTTHSFAMNQRHLWLGVLSVVRLSSFAYRITVAAPPSATVAPPGYYMLFVVHAEVPSRGIWVRVR
ncbi:aldehyde oxidase GLOX-like [Rhodamnia argentea]|uniref:Aldehyde oxidase GLOX-like n=1 Tax=Rhodamnia argentea TaxID=178133 RepID=A0A8B8QN52_9MYRT|nr:aldehyde oxidase GLOX-like [Rhodamnia argentea]